MLLKLVLNIFHTGMRIGLLALSVLFLGQIHSHAGVVTNLTQTNLLIALTNGGLVTFLTDGTLSLTTNLIIRTNTIIDGVGRNIILSGGGTTGTNGSSSGVRLFFVTNNATLTLLNITVANGRSTNGAGIFNSLGSTVILSNCVLAANLAIGTASKSGAPGKDNGDLSDIDGGDGSKGTPGMGGGIYNLGTVSIIQSIVSGNDARGSSGGNGGKGGNDSSFGGNGGDGGNAGLGAGGGIYNLGTVFITNSTFQFNVADGGDGGLAGVGGTASFSGKPGDGGVAGAGYGGGIYNSGAVTINNSTFVSNNVSGGDTQRAFFDDSDGTSGSGGLAFGGGIHNRGAANITNSTFTQNFTRGGKGGDAFSGPFLDAGNGGAARGGAIYASNNVVLVNCTIATNNTTGGERGVSPLGGDRNGSVGSQQGGNIFRLLGQVRLRNTILAKGTNGLNYTGTVIDDGYNLSSDNTPNFTANSSSNNVNARLVALANNGGLTATMALLNGSAAVDNGDPGFCLATDQRGIARPQGIRCDIGAYERQPAFDISGRIFDGTNGIVGALVRATNESRTNSALSSTNGFYTISELVVGTYNVSAGTGYSPSNQVLVISNNATNVNFSFNAVTLSRPIATNTDSANSAFSFLVSSKPNFHFKVQFSSNLVNWTSGSNSPVLTVTNGLLILNISRTNYQSQNFYRVVAQP